MRQPSSGRQGCFGANPAVDHRRAQRAQQLALQGPDAIENQVEVQIGTMDGEKTGTSLGPIARLRLRQVPIEPTQMPEQTATSADRSRVRRHPERGSNERAEAYAVLDAGQIAHVGFAIDGQPFVIPMLYARLGDSVLLHGNVGSRLLRHLSTGAACCLTVTHLDGWVLARSHFNHSANYRSVVVFGSARPVDDAQLKAAALTHLVDALIPGRAADSRPSDPSELAATSVLQIDIEECSVKSRSGPPKDHPDDLAWPTWAGVIPLALTPGTPEPAPDLAAGHELRDYWVVKPSPAL